MRNRVSSQRTPPLLRALEWSPALPVNYTPVRPAHFDVERIVLAKGSVTTPQRRRFVERICALYPAAPVADRTDVSHNFIDLGLKSPLELHRHGKRTLVFGELAESVRFSAEEGNSCPNYWHFSPYGFCPYGCKYCYLAGTRGVWFSPTVKIYVNLPEMLERIDTVARRVGQPTAFYLGKLQDGLALDPLTGYSTAMVPFFADHPFARLVVLTKSANTDLLAGLAHGGRTVLSWSLNPPEIAAAFEERVPRVEERITAMRRCAEKGYPVRAVIMPLIPTPNWQELYGRFIEVLLSAVRLDRLTLGGICIFKGARALMESKLGRGNCISSHLAPDEVIVDGRARYARETRLAMYRHLIGVARRIDPSVPLALCLEEADLWRDLAPEVTPGRCNCVL